MNYLESLLSAEFIRAFAWTLLHSVWQGGLLALVAAGLLIILRKHQPAIRYAILYILLMLLPVFFAVTFLYTYHPVSTNFLTGTEAAVMSGLPESNILPGKPTTSESVISHAWYIHTIKIFENQAGWLVLFWFIGVFIFLIRFSGSLFYVYRLKNHQVYQVEDRWNADLHKLSERIRLNKRVRLAESALARIPMTIGYLKPVILLPLGTLTCVPPQQIDAILLHELAHILRKDYLLNIIQSVIELLFFYHPVTWWLSGLLRQEREHICDDLAIGVHHDQITYIKALTTMEELNSKSPLLANAMTGPKKKLLLRAKRLLTPVKLRKGFGEGIVTFILLISLIFTLSVNAISLIPTAYDLTGRESGERVFNFLPFNPDPIPVAVSEAPSYQPIAEKPVSPELPDTIISKSKSGKVTVTVYTDSTDATDEKEIKVFVERLEKNLGGWEQAKNDYEKQVIVMENNTKGPNNMRKMVLIKSGDSIQIINGDTMIWLPEGYDTSIFTDGGFQFYGFDIPEFPEIPDFPDRSDMKYYYFDDGRIECEKEHEKALREYEFELRDVEKDKRMMERDRRMMEKELGDRWVIVPPPDAPDALQFNWETPPPPVNNSEKIIRQELRDDGLVFPHKGYIIDIDSKGMYINGEKQSKEIYRKYKRLAEGLDNMSLDNGNAYRIIF